MRRRRIRWRKSESIKNRLDRFDVVDVWSELVIYIKYIQWHLCIVWVVLAYEWTMIMTKSSSIRSTDYSADSSHYNDESFIHSLFNHWEMTLMLPLAWKRSLSLRQVSLTRQLFKFLFVVVCYLLHWII